MTDSGPKKVEVVIASIDADDTIYWVKHRYYALHYYLCSFSVLTSHFSCGWTLLHLRQESSNFRRFICRPFAIVSKKEEVRNEKTNFMCSILRKTCQFSCFVCKTKSTSSSSSSFWQWSCRGNHLFKSQLQRLKLDRWISVYRAPGSVNEPSLA